MKKKLILSLLAIASLMVSCQSGTTKEERIEAARKNLVDARREAMLKEAQERLADIDSTLQAVEAEYDTLNATVSEHRKNLCATPEELQRLNNLKVYRDSLKGLFEVECAKIKYIHRKQKQ